MNHHLAFRAGVTGKRDLDPTIAGWVRAQIGFILGTIKTAVEDVRNQSMGVYEGTSATLRAISPLAEGADRLFAEEALGLGYQLDCPLPFERQEYCKDFPASVGHFELLLKQATAVFELDGTRHSGEHPYEAVGRLVLDQCDVLIAVWDSQPAKGRGGTEHIMEIALGRRMPIFCLRPDLKEIVLLSSEGLRGGEPLTAKAIADIIENLTAPPWWKQVDPGPDATGAYTASTPLGSTVLGRVWKTFETVMSRPKLAASIDPPPLTDPHYLEVNEPAKRLAGLYRGAFVVNYTLGTLAVFFALFSYADHDRIYLWLTLELLSIAAVVLLIRRLRKNRWHYRTVDCRYLAEQLRILHFIQPLALPPPLPHLPAHHMHSSLERSWMEWRLRAIARQIPMPSIRLTRQYIEERFRPIVQDWIPGQIDYHQRTSTRLDRIEHRLHGLSKLFVAIAGLACVAHFILHDPPVGPWLTFLAAGFPAAAGACHAISTQGEFRRLADRSEAMVLALKHAASRFERLMKGNLSGAAARREATQLAQLMLEEVADWQVLYRKDVPEA